MPRADKNKRERHPELLDRNFIEIDEENVHVDEQGKRWITANVVADIWNYRAGVEYDVPGTDYDRFSVRSRRSDMRERYAGRTNRVDEDEYTLPSMKTPFGHLYGEEESWTIPLHPRNKARLDVKNRENPKKGEKGRFISSKQKE
jgi:hypothetical protein